MSQWAAITQKELSWHMFDESRATIRHKSKTTRTLVFYVFCWMSDLKTWRLFLKRIPKTSLFPLSPQWPFPGSSQAPQKISVAKIQKDLKGLQVPEFCHWQSYGGGTEDVCVGMGWPILFLISCRETREKLWTKWTMSIHRPTSKYSSSQQQQTNAKQTSPKQ